MHCQAGLQFCFFKIAKFNIPLVPFYLLTQHLLEESICTPRNNTLRAICLSSRGPGGTPSPDCPCLATAPGLCPRLPRSRLGRRTPMGRPTTSALQGEQQAIRAFHIRFCTSKVVPQGAKLILPHSCLAFLRDSGEVNVVWSKAKQPQFPQPLLIRLVLQTLHQLRCPSLDTLQHLNVSLVVGGPKLNTVFEVWPHQGRVQGHDHFPTPAGHTIPDTSQDAIGFLGHLGTLLAHIQAAVNQHPQVLFCWAAFQPLFPKPVALHGVAVAQVQDLALGLVKPHTIGLGPSIQPVQVPLQSLPTLKQINAPTPLGVICKLTEGALDPFIQIIDKDIKQNWPQHRALGNTACDRPPSGVNSIHHHSLGPAIQPVLNPAKSTPVQAMSSQFLQENAVGNRVKGFTEV
ncbi:hypothetical protein QYF61_015756 [Mycteria americana]|uniref:Uncharacterized protein n=1 Tax=Mycteria americana TaxID=33587 RepID=A0AAN7NGD5_MYCAM|nr:hypothetical protein QYF61_015756 [Mycteria americana]